MHILFLTAERQRVGNSIQGVPTLCVCGSRAVGQSPLPPLDRGLLSQIVVVVKVWLVAFAWSAGLQNFRVAEHLLRCHLYDTYLWCDILLLFHIVAFFLFDDYFHCLAVCLHDVQSLLQTVSAATDDIIVFGCGVVERIYCINGFDIRRASIYRDVQLRG